MRIFITVHRRLEDVKVVAIGVASSNESVTHSRKFLERICPNKRNDDDTP